MITERRRLNAGALDSEADPKAAPLLRYDFAGLVEEGDLEPDGAGSPRLIAEAACDVTKGDGDRPRWLVKLRLKEPADITDFPADAALRALLLFREKPEGEWRVCAHRGFKVALSQLETQRADCWVRSTPSNAHHPAFFRVNDEGDGPESDTASDVSDEDGGLTYEQHIKRHNGVKRAKGRPDGRFLTHAPRRAA